MISYEPFWDTLYKSQESTYTLINNHHISSSTINKLRKNKPTTTTTLDELCEIFHCELHEIAVYVGNVENEPETFT